MSVQDLEAFEELAVSNVFDTEDSGKKGSLWTVWHLTPRVFEKEEEDRARRDAEEKAKESAERAAAGQESKEPVEAGRNVFAKLSKKTITRPGGLAATPRKETVLAYWDPDIFHSKVLWLVTCLFGAPSARYTFHPGMQPPRQLSSCGCGR